MNNLSFSETNTKENKCTSCEQLFTGNFCNYCGQKKVGRITNLHLAHDVMHTITHADLGIFSYAKRLFIEPGKVARQYVDGKRKIFNPIQFLMMTIASVVIMMSLIGFYQMVEQMQPKPSSGMEKVMLQKLKGYNDFINKNTNFIALLLLPAMAFFAKQFFDKYRNNFAEHLVVLIFGMSLSNMLSCLFLGLAYFTHMGVTPILLSTVFTTIFSFTLTYKQFYGLSWFHSAWRCVLIYLMSMLVYILISIVVVTIILLST